MRKFIAILTMVLVTGMITGCGDSQAEIERKARLEQQRKAAEWAEKFWGQPDPPPAPSKGAGMPRFK